MALTSRGLSWSDYDPLEEVLLFSPGSELGVADPSKVLFRERVEVRRAAEEHRMLAAAFRAANVKVRMIEPDAGITSANMVYVRDQFSVVDRDWALMGEMHPVRAGEVEITERALAELGFHTTSIFPPGRFEGADLVKASPTNVFIGVGHRSNYTSAQQITEIFGSLGVRVTRFDIPERSVPQHLLGFLQVLDDHLVLVRTQLVPSVADQLASMGWTVVSVAESDDVVTRNAMNFVTIGPRRVIIPTDCNEMERLLLDVGCTVVARVPCVELFKAGGGLACMTGILRRSAA